MLSGLALNACQGQGTQQKEADDQLKGRVNHSVCRWCYGKIPMEQFCEQVHDLGLRAMDLVTPQEWSILKKNNLECSMATADFVSLTEGFNHTEFHDPLQEAYRELIPKAAAEGIKNVICFSGNRKGISEEEGLDNCARGLEPLVKLAEKENIVLTMELLNSKVNHADYQCDHTAWGAALAEKIGSPNFKLLYDIYHMQIMEGDIIATIREYHPYIGHYHTGGVPGRNEINDSQELNYPAIIQAILDTGYQGYIAQEFIPTYDDPIAALKEGVMICDV